MLAVFLLGLVLGVPVADGGALIFQFAVRVVLQNVVRHEFDRVVGARAAHLRKGFHDSRGDGLLKVSLCRQIVDTDRRLLGHRGQFSLSTDISISIAAFRVQIVLFPWGCLFELLVDLLLGGWCVGVFLLYHLCLPLFFYETLFNYIKNFKL